MHHANQMSVLPSSKILAGFDTPHPMSISAFRLPPNCRHRRHRINCPSRGNQTLLRRVAQTLRAIPP